MFETGRKSNKLALVSQMSENKKEVVTSKERDMVNIKLGWEL